jgi:hypothetical protein
MRKLIRIAVALMAVIPAVSGRLNVARVALSFEANQGQTDRAVKFLSGGDVYALFLTPTEAVFKLRKATPSDKEPAVLRMRLVSADGAAKLSGTGQYAGTANYFHRQRFQPVAHRSHHLRKGPLSGTLSRRGCGLLRKPARVGV